MDEQEIDLGNLLLNIKNEPSITKYSGKLSKRERFILYLANILYNILTQNDFEISPFTKAKISKSQVMQVFEVSSETAREYLDLVDNEMKNFDPTISYMDKGTLYIFLKFLEDNIRGELQEIDFKIRTDGYVLIAYTNDDIVNNILARYLKNIYSKRWGYEIIEREAITENRKKKNVLIILSFDTYHDSIIY